MSYTIKQMVCDYAVVTSSGRVVCICNFKSNAEEIADILNSDNNDICYTHIDLLTDTEQRIFLSAMSRERTVCKTVDDMHTERSIDSNVSLVQVCDSIVRKVKKIWER